MDARQSDDEQQFALMLAAYHETLVARGTPPPETDVPPALAQRLREAQACVDQLHWLWGPTGQSNSLAPLTGELQQSLPTAAALADRIGRFRLVRTLGHGGAGIVFLAVDPTTARQVALKVPRPESLMSPAARQRFLREAEAAARLNHRHIVAVYEVAEAGPVCYIVSEYCAGPSLATWQAAGTPRCTPREAARLVADLAAGVQHAHVRGVLHRDLKPSNVLLCPLADPAEGHPSEAALSSFVAKVGDFGLAKLVEQSDDETRSGTVLGTPRYMAPEQAEGRVHDIGVYTDVHALGAILYELLTGVPPFRGENDTETLRRVLLDEAMPPRRLCPGIPQDLEAICLKCLEKNPVRRYSTADALESDLRRFVSDLPTLARPLSPPTRLWKWARRRPAWAALASVSLLAVATIILGTLSYDSRLRAALARAEVEATISRNFNYTSGVRLAHDAIQAEHMSDAGNILSQQIPLAGEADRREFSWHYLWGLCHQEVREFRGHVGDVHSVSFLPDGRTLATAGKDATIRLWDIASGRPGRVLRGHQGEVNHVAILSGGRLASAGDDGTIRLWELAAGRQLQVLSAAEGAVFGLVATCDGLLASGGKDGVLRLWNVESGELEWESEASLPIESLALLFDQRTLVTSHEKGPLRFWDLATKCIVLEMDLAKGSQRATVATSAALDDFAVADKHGHLVAFRRSSDDWKQIVMKSLSSNAVGAHAMAFSPRDNTLATGSRDGLVQLWAAGETLERCHILSGHGQRVWSLAWSPDGRFLASAAADGSVKLWDVARPGGSIVYPRVYAPIRSISVSRDGASVLTANDDGVLHQWDRTTRLPRKARTAFPETNHKGSAVCFFGSSHEATAVGLSGTLKRWDVDTNRLTTLFHLRANVSHPISVSDDGTRLAIYDDASIVVLFDLKANRLLRRLELHDDVLGSLALSADGRQLAAVTSTIELFDTETGRHGPKLSSEANIGPVVFSSDGAQLISAGADEAIRIWELPTGRPLATMIGQSAPVTRLALSPSGRTLASASDEPPVVKLWDLTTRAQLMTFTDLPDPVTSLAFAPDNRALLVTCASERGHSGQLIEWALNSPGAREIVDEVPPRMEQMQQSTVRPNESFFVVLKADSNARRLVGQPFVATPIVDFSSPSDPIESTNEFADRWSVEFRPETPAAESVAGTRSDEAPATVDLVADASHTLALDGARLVLLKLPRIERPPKGVQRLRIAFRTPAGKPVDDQTGRSLLSEILVYRDVDANGRLNLAIDRLVGRCDAPRLAEGVQTVELAEPPSAGVFDPVTIAASRCIDLFQAVHDYAVAHGFVTGYPTFRFGTEPAHPTVQCVLLRAGKPSTIVASPREFPVPRDFPRADCENQADLLGHWLRGASEWAPTKGYTAALPTFRTRHRLAQVAEFEVTLLALPQFEKRLIHVTEIRERPTDPQLFRDVHDWAARHGFVSGFPTFVRPQSHYDCVVVHPTAAELVEIPLDDLPLAD